MSGRRPSAFDRAVVAVATGPVGRGASFALSFAAALIRGLRGDARHPEERRVPDPD